jgi:hypothetical protein
MIVASEDDERAPSGDLPLSLPGFDDGQGNRDSTLLTARRPGLGLRLDTSFLTDFSNFTDNSNASAHDPPAVEMLAPRWGNEIGSLSLLLLRVFTINVASLSSL